LLWQLSTPDSTATRTIISIATEEDLELRSVEFTQAFIQADRLPEGVNGLDDSLSRSLQALHTPTPLVVLVQRGVVGTSAVASRRLFRTVSTQVQNPDAMSATASSDSLKHKNSD